MKRTLENGKKTSFRPDFGPFGQTNVEHHKTTKRKKYKGVNKEQKRPYGANCYWNLSEEKHKDLKKGTHPTFGHSVANIFFVFFDDIKYFS